MSSLPLPARDLTIMSCRCINGSCSGGLNFLASRYGIPSHVIRGIQLGEISILYIYTMAARATISTRKLVSALESCTLLAARGTRARLIIGPADLTRVSLRPALTRTTRHHSTVVPSIPPEDSYDIVIIGGANAGLALACALCT